jgi:protease II
VAEENRDPANDLSAYRTIAGYSPYDNVKRQPYLPMLVTAGLRDSRTLRRSRLSRST